MPTDSALKVDVDHLRRDAFLYVRQSSLRQVFENTESTKRQYALRERAVALGWPLERVHVIDSDLGLSGAQASDRDGFQSLVTEVALGHAGIVLGLEVSRLARNNADWHRLLELAAMSRTLILDEDGIYDPSHFNDRLLLGLKGTMSEAELHILKSRLQGGILNKARRGELEMPLPIGLVYDGAGRVVLDPDRQVQSTVRLLFEVFNDVGSACAVVRRLRDQEVLFPRRIRRGIGKGDLLWGLIDVSRVLQILHNPRYAGAFVYGRSRIACNAQLRPVQRDVSQQDWKVLIRNAHAGYIDWLQFERNELRLRQNLGFAPGERGRMPREGNALLQGRVLCGRCGARMRVHYEPLGGRLRAYYRCCDEVVRRAGKPCQAVHGPAVDAAVGALLLETVAPAAIEVALAVQDEIAQRIEQAAARRQAQLQRTRYEAELARRRYAKVDPDHRLVADALEADWNQRLRELDSLQQAHERQRNEDQAQLDEPARKRIVDLARDFPRLWNDERTSALERKRMLALLIEDVTLVAGPSVAVHVRWRGGRTQSLYVDKPRPIARIRKTLPEVVKLIDELLETSTDKQIAVKLNALGHRNWRGEAFTMKKVILVRYAYALKSRFERLRERGMLTGQEVAGHLGVSSTTVHQLGRLGILKRHLYGNNHRCLYEPPGNVTLIKGAGSRYGGRPPRLIAAQLSEQGAV
ncbi:recombinase family protein [Variovorax sp. J22R115]|uniref:recombinase family protein n=1 Tax=Variovorax sp. J22R115 TaxID=3053509 RepID=UPI0025761BAB|nr:recombinase family protein [Variovorax sp. J22R115]MDM0050622.1 recombinase family protein [Variovorax sp. J22R115]